jgi:large subunit ribosomal protein L15
MKYNELQINSNHAPRRVGRGISAGQGKTAGRGTKGQKSRTGSSRRPGFEGGQNPLIKRFPKLRGFKSHRPITENVYLSQLNELSGTVDSEALAKAGVISSPYASIKVVATGKIDKKLTIKLPAASTKAQAAIEKAGGTFSAVPQLGRPAKKPKR